MNLLALKIFLLLICSLSNGLVEVTTDSVTGGELMPCNFEVYQWDFDLDDPDTAVLLVTVDAMVDGLGFVGDLDLAVYFDYAEPTAANVGTGILQAQIDGGVSGSAQIPRSCNLEDSNSLFVSVLNQGFETAMYNVTVEVLTISEDNSVEILMESFERTHAFTNSRIIRPDEFLDRYFFHKITFSDEFKEEISLVSSFTIKVESRQASNIPVFLSYSHFPVSQIGCGDITTDKEATNDLTDTFTFPFSSCDIANVDAIYLGLVVDTNFDWAIIISPDSSDVIQTTTVRPNDEVSEALLYSATISNTQFFEVNTASFDLEGKQMIINVDNVVSGSIELYQVTPSCFTTFFLCEETSTGCRYVFEECELKRWRDLGLRVFTFGLNTGNINTKFTFSAQIVDILTETIEVVANDVTVVTDQVGVSLTNHYELSIASSSEFTCDHKYWLDIYVYVDSEDDFVTLYLNNGEISSLGDSQCGTTYGVCSVLDNAATSLVRGCGFQINSCELSQFSNSSWYLSVQGKRPDGTLAEEEFYRSDISYTISIKLAEAQIFGGDDLPLIQTGTLEGNFYSNQYVIPASMITEGTHLSLQVTYLSNSADDIFVYIRPQGQAGVPDASGCLDFDDFYNINSGSTGTISIFGCWSLDDTYQDKDIYFSIRGNGAVPLVKEYVLSLDVKDEGELITLVSGVPYIGEIFEDQNLNFTIASTTTPRSLLINFEPESILGAIDYQIQVHSASSLACTRAPNPDTSFVRNCNDGPCLFFLDACSFENSLKDFIFTVDQIGTAASQVDHHRFQVTVTEVLYERSGAELVVGTSQKFCSLGFERQFYQFTHEPSNAENLVVRIYFDSLIETPTSEREFVVKMYSPENEVLPEDFGCSGEDFSCTDNQECLITINSCDLQTGNYVLEIYPDNSDNLVPDLEYCYTIEVETTPSYDSDVLQLREGRFGEFFGTEGRRIAFEVPEVLFNDTQFRPITRLTIELGAADVVEPWGLQPYVLTRPLNKDEESTSQCSCDEILTDYECLDNPCSFQFHWCQIEDIQGELNIFLQPREFNTARIPYSVTVDDFSSGRFRALPLDDTFRPLEVSNLGYTYFTNSEESDIIVLNFNLYDVEIRVYGNSQGPATSQCGSFLGSCNAVGTIPPNPFAECRIVIPNCDSIYYSWVSIEIVTATERSQIRYSAAPEVGFEAADVGDQNSGVVYPVSNNFYEITLDSSKFYRMNLVSIETAVTLTLRNGRFCSSGSTIASDTSVSNTTAFVSTFWVLPCLLQTGSNVYTIQIDDVFAEPENGTAYQFTFEEYEYTPIALTEGTDEVFTFENFLVDTDSYYQVYSFQSTANTDTDWTRFRFTVDTNFVDVYKFSSDTDLGIDALSSTSCAAAQLFGFGQISFESSACCNEGAFNYFIVGGATTQVDVTTLAEIIPEASFVDTGVVMEDADSSPDAITDANPSTGFVTNYQLEYQPASRSQFLTIKLESTIAGEFIDTYVNYNTPAGNNVDCFQTTEVVRMQTLVDTAAWRIWPCEASREIFFGYETSADEATLDNIAFEVKEFGSLVDDARNTLSAPVAELSVFTYDFVSPASRYFSILDSMRITSEINQENIAVDIYMSLNGLSNGYVPPVLDFTTNDLPLCALGTPIVDNIGFQTTALVPQTESEFSLCNREEDTLYYVVQGNSQTGVSVLVDIEYEKVNHTVLTRGDNLFEGAADNSYYVIDTEGETLTPQSYIVVHINNFNGSSLGVDFRLFEGCSEINSCEDVDECVFLLTPCDLVTDEPNYFVLSYDFSTLPLDSFNIFYEIKEINEVILPKGTTVGELISEDYITTYKYEIEEPQAITEFNFGDSGCNSDDFTVVYTRGSPSTCRDDSPAHLSFCDLSLGLPCNFETSCELLSDSIYITVFAKETRNDIRAPVKFTITADSFTDTSSSKTITNAEGVDVTISDAGSFFRLDFDRSVEYTSVQYEVSINPEIVLEASVRVDIVEADRCNPESTDRFTLTEATPSVFDTTNFQCDPNSAYIRFERVVYGNGVDISNADQVIGRILFTQNTGVFTILSENAVFQKTLSVSNLDGEFATINSGFNTPTIHFFDTYWPSHILKENISETGRFVEIGDEDEEALRTILTSRWVRTVKNILPDSDGNDVTFFGIDTKQGTLCAPLSGPVICGAQTGEECTDYAYPFEVSGPIGSIILPQETLTTFDYGISFETPAVELDSTVCYEFDEDPTFFFISGDIAADQVYKFTVHPSAVLDERMYLTGGSLNFELSADALSYQGAPQFSTSNFGEYEFTWRCPPTKHHLYDFFSMAVTAIDFPPFTQIDYEIMTVSPIELESGETVQNAFGYYNYTFGSLDSVSDFFILYAEGTDGVDVHISANVVNHGCDSGLSCTIVGGVCTILVTECNSLTADTTYYIHLDGVADITIIDTSSETPISVSVSDVYSQTGLIPNSDAVTDRIIILEVDLEDDTDFYHEYSFTSGFSALFGSLETYFIYPDLDTCDISRSNTLNLFDCEKKNGGTVLAVLIARSFTFCGDLPYSFNAEIDSQVDNVVVTSTVTEDFQVETFSVEREGEYLFSVSTPDDITKLHGIDVYGSSLDGVNFQISRTCGGGSSQSLSICSPLEGFDYYFTLNTDIPSPQITSVDIHAKIYERSELTAGETTDGYLGEKPFFGEGFTDHYYFTWDRTNIESIVFSFEVQRGEAIRVSLGDCAVQHVLDCFQYDEECVFEFREDDNFRHITTLSSESAIFIDVSGIKTNYSITITQGTELCSIPAEGEIDFCSDQLRMTQSLYGRGDFTAQDVYAQAHHQALIESFKRCSDETCRAFATDCDITEECISALRNFSCEFAFPICASAVGIDDQLTIRATTGSCQNVVESCGKTFTEAALPGFSCELSHYTSSDDITFVEASGPVTLVSLTTFLLALLI